MLTAKFGSIWPSCFRGEDQNMKKLTDGRQVMAIPGELKNDEKRAITPRLVIRFISKLQGM